MAVVPTVAGEGNGGMEGIMNPWRGEGTDSGQEIRRGKEMGDGEG